MVIVLSCIAAGVLIVNYLKGNNMIIQLQGNSCTNDTECSWEITNCCTETAGAKWECINEKNEQMGCPKTVICPEVISPRPNSTCGCVRGMCKVK